ncbi:hypothetical protein A2U01_0060882, partial [Trifolium medium]|nr:hypothetical protein [Trifolium medium]
KGNSPSLGYLQRRDKPTKNYHGKETTTVKNSYREAKEQPDSTEPGEKRTTSNPGNKSLTLQQQLLRTPPRRSNKVIHEKVKRKILPPPPTARDQSARRLACPSSTNHTNPEENTTIHRQPT